MENYTKEETAPERVTIWVNKTDSFPYNELSRIKITTMYCDTDTTCAK